MMRKAVKVCKHRDVYHLMSLFDPPQYLRTYGLKEAPYSTFANERYFYITPAHQEALAMAAKVIRDREGAALIFGKFGTGKTSLMLRLFSEMRERPEFRVAVIKHAAHCPTEFQLAEEIIEGFGGKSVHNYRKGRADQIKLMLLENFKQGLNSVLLIDEAHEFPAKVLDSLRGYLNFETGEAKLVQIILFAQPPILKKLAYAKALRDRLWKTELVDMSRAEMEDMMRWRFHQAGGTVFPIEEAAIDLLFEITNGHPRKACAIAQLALEHAAKGTGAVTPALIDEAKQKRF